MKIWLDDVRPMPAGFDVHCINSIQAVAFVCTGRVAHISLDHDLGGDDKGQIVVDTIEELASESKIKRMTWDVHSANPEGRRYMEMGMRSAERFWDFDEEMNALGNE